MHFFIKNITLCLVAIVFATTINAQKVITIPKKKQLKSKTSTVTAPKKSEVSIFTSPEGANVYLDDKEIGKTPIKDYKIVYGEHTFKVGLEGYKPYSVTKNFNTSSDVIQKFLEKEEQKPCSLLVVSKPDSADIFLDGKRVGITPLWDVMVISQGFHNIEVFKPGYDTLKISRNFEKDTEIINEPLKKTPTKYTTLYLVSEPIGAKVLINDVEIGTTPIQGYKIKQGKHKLQLVLDSFDILTEEIVLNKLEQYIPKTLSKIIIHPAILNINMQPAGSGIYLNNQLIGQTPLQGYQVPPGDYTLEVINEQCESYTETFKVDQKQVKDFNGLLISNAPLEFDIPGVPNGKFKMIKVVGGTFVMGATSEQVGFDSDEKPTHEVRLKSFYISETEVTQELYAAVMGRNPSISTGNLNLPVESVSWEDCQIFINELNKLTGAKFRLPTEAEWEFAARGGTKSQGYPYSGSNVLNDVGWDKQKSKEQLNPVKMLKPNELGIYDMSGNVAEWCMDFYGQYESSFQENPVGLILGTDRIIRGGSYSDEEKRCRVSARNSYMPSSCFENLGIRLVCD